MNAVKRIKTSRYGREVVEAVQAAADHLVERGGGALLVACTELSIIGGGIRSTVRVFDSAQILAEAIVAEARKAS
jgi:aspartate racemase